MIMRLGCSFLWCTISVHNGFILYKEQFLGAYGSLSALKFTVDKRFWTSTTITDRKWTVAITNARGCDRMCANGEPDFEAYTMGLGSQRPAQYRSLKESEKVMVKKENIEEK